jgi:hypothetical protein
VEGAALRDAALAAVTVRYREVHGFTGADPAEVVVADAGRGTQVAWFGLRPVHRLPLRAHYGYLVLKNGVPVGYGDASCLFEWCEIAFNVFETFRQGESAHLFARLLGFLVQWLGIRVFHLSPYQLGRDNEEALASGAFWFYYKLGFRPTRPALARLAREEARRIARRPGFRSSRPTLARLATGRVTLGVGGRPSRMVCEFDASLVARQAAATAGARSADRVVRALACRRWQTWPAAERTAFARLVPVLAAIPDLAAWPVGDRRALVAVIRAKGGRSETEYVRRLRGHRRLRHALLALGTGT